MADVSDFPEIPYRPLIPPFRAWVQKTLPAVYDDGLSYMELLSKVFVYLNSVIKSTDGIITDFNALHDYVYNFFKNLDVQEEIDNKLDQMAEDGTLQAILSDFIVFTMDTATEFSDCGLGVGTKIETRGFYEINDGGAALYILEEGDADGITKLACKTEGIVAVLQRSDTMHFKSFGAVGDGETDDTQRLKAAIDFVSPWAMDGTTVGGEPTGGTLIIDKGKFLITDTIYMNPLLTIRGEGIQRSGVARIGYSVSPSQLVFEIPTTNIPAISVTGLVLEDGEPVRAKLQNRYVGTDVDNGTLGQIYGCEISDLAILSNNDSTMVGILCIGAVGLKLEQLSVTGFRYACAMNSSWFIEINNNRFAGIVSGLYLHIDINQCIVNATTCTCETTDFETYPRLWETIETDPHPELAMAIMCNYVRGTTFNSCDTYGERGVVLTSSYSVTFSGAYFEGPIKYAFDINSSYFTINGLWVWPTVTGAKAFNIVTAGNGLISGVRLNNDCELFDSVPNSASNIVVSGVSPASVNKNTNGIVFTDNDIIYVSPDGDDTTGTGTYGNPYRTVSRAFVTTKESIFVNLLGDCQYGTYICQGKSVIIFGQGSVTIDSTQAIVDSKIVFNQPLIANQSLDIRGFCQIGIESTLTGTKNPFYASRTGILAIGGIGTAKLDFPFFVGSTKKCWALDATGSMTKEGTIAETPFSNVTVINQ